jgi:nucleotide-binding universal stress UspA family protein
LFADNLHQGTSGKRQIAEMSRLMLQENGTILHATDLTDASASALDLACTLALSRHSKLTILHVLTPAIVAHDWKTLLARQTAMERINRLAVPETIETERRIVRGDPVIAILEAATELRASVIVLGRKARVGLKRVLNHSVAEQVVRRADRPVVTVSGTCSELYPTLTRLETIVEDGNEGVAALFASGKFRQIAITGG